MDDLNLWNLPLACDMCSGEAYGLARLEQLGQMLRLASLRWRRLVPKAGPTL
eukprot:COSAG01_NODE_72965_length_251_cov_1.171053_1_plen_51_part_01